MPNCIARLAPLVALVGVVLLPELASACAVCSAGRDEENRAAFLFMTIFMSLTPLALIGGLVFWIRRRYRALEAHERHETHVAHEAAGARNP